MTFKRKIPLFIFLLILVLIAVFYGLFYFFSRPVSEEKTESVKIEIPSGISVKRVSNLLEEKEIIRNGTVFYYSVRFPFLLKVLFPKEDRDFAFNLKSGTYNLDSSMNFIQIQKLLSSGQQEYIKVSFPEGLSVSAIAQILEENRICSAVEFKHSFSSKSLLAEYNIPFDTFEGYLFPDTYFFTLSMDSDQVIRLMVDNFFEKIKSVPNLSEKNPKDLFDTVRLASIVEREYRIEDEAPLIASVFKNRLKRNIGLYSCATIVYIITEIQGKEHPDRILYDDLKIDSPYNTYLYAGLPPGPISNPGLVALNAATNTPKTNYYFFQIADANEGRHVFTQTFEEHIESHNLYTKKVSGK